MRLCGGGPVTYNLNVGRIEMDLGSAPPPAPSGSRPAPFSVVMTRKVEQIIGDFDFETI
ncbi:MAG: hypothetical protein ACE5H9_16545 [Anaerolineae bacterium]